MLYTLNCGMEHVQVSGGLVDSYTPQVDKQHTPCLGMEFESEENAFQFYNYYGRLGGFSIRKQHHSISRKDRVMINRKFVCAKEGERQLDKRRINLKKHKPETRTNCLATMYIRLNRETNRWFVSKFLEGHNHPLHLPECAHMMSSQRKLSIAEGVNAGLGVDAGISLKASHDLMSVQVGGRERVGFTAEDLKGYLCARRQRDLEYGEAPCLMRYFQKKAAKEPFFYYAVQLDAVELTTNVFWADHQMILDYAYFGDTVHFDTTFLTNKEYRPFACFVGFNHFKETVVFGAALLYDETAASFEWLFETFLHAMSGKKPKTIFTIQDEAMAKALSHVMPNVYHGLCTWHLLQSASKHLGHLLKDGSNFLCELKACVYEFEDENELIQAWKKVVDGYDLQDNLWMNGIWELRHKWAHVYMKWIFTAGIQSTQPSESMNGKLRNYLKAKYNIIEFFTHFDRVVMDVRDNEWKSVFKSREQLPELKIKKSIMLVQASRHYTHPLFELFQDEFETSLCCQVKHCDKLEGKLKFVVGEYGKDTTYIVEGNPIAQSVHCSCRKFEHFGILCSHALKVLDRMNVMELPSRYVLRRWRQDAKDCLLHWSTASVDEEDPNLVVFVRYRTLCHKLLQLAARASTHKSPYEYVFNTVNDMAKQVDMMNISAESVAGGDCSSHRSTASSPQLPQDVTHNIAQTTRMEVGPESIPNEDMYNFSSNVSQPTPPDHT